MNDNTQVHAQHIGAEDFDEKLKAAGEKPVMVDFYAEWCGPCKIAAPVVDELAGEYAGKAEVYKVDVDQNQELSMRYGVMSIPTVIMFKNGEAVNKQVGFPGKQGYVQMLDAALEE